MPSYFCHQCNLYCDGSEGTNGNMTVTCTRCGLGFIEEINNESQQDRLQPESPSGALGHEFRDLLPGLHFHEPGSVFSFGMNRMMNFLDSGALDQVMAQLLGQVDGSGGLPPPASPGQLALIKTASISEDQVKEGLQCFVCLDEFKLDASAEVLSCQHHFHPQCIRPWLEKRGTCPVCRKLLASPDDEAEPADAEAEAPIGAVGGGGGASIRAFPILFSTSFAASESEPTTRSQARRRRSRDYVEDDCD